MTKQLPTIRKKKFRFRNEYWHVSKLTVSEWLAWLESHVCFWRRHARPIMQPKVSARDQDTNMLAFTCSLVALHAKLAQHKGSLSADGFVQFRCLFPLGDEESQNLRTLFKLAWEDDEPLASHIQRMVRCYPGRSDLFATALEGLARHMLADGKPSRQQLMWLNDVAGQFGVHRFEMRHIMHKAELPLEARPHALFDVPKHASKEQIKLAYRRFMTRAHPDKVSTAALPETRMASEHLSRAGNLAYKRLRG